MIGFVEQISKRCKLGSSDRRCLEMPIDSGEHRLKFLVDVRYSLLFGCSGGSEVEAMRDAVNSEQKGKKRQEQLVYAAFLSAHDGSAV